MKFEEENWRERDSMNESVVVVVVSVKAIDEKMKKKKKIIIYTKDYVACIGL